MDPLKGFKDAQKQGWSHFTPLEVFTTPPAALLVKHAKVAAGQHVLDVACGTGVVGITAARKGAKVTGLDLTPALLARARENIQLSGVDIDLHEGDVEELPFEANTFDVVMSQFGHMFAPRPDVAIEQMLRVLKPGGVIAFSTWPPDGFTGRTFSLVGKYAPPPPPGVSPPPLWGDPNVVRERLGSKVQQIVFDRGRMLTPTLSPSAYRDMFEHTAGPVLKLVESLSVSDPAKLAEFRKEFEGIVSDYFEDNVVRMDFLMTRAIKV